jgi:uncharacterized membrane protein YfcA
VNILAGFADISLAQLLLVAGVAMLASVVGGLAGYGTGALMPLVLVPLIGAEPVVPIIAISAIITNFSRATAYFRYVDRRRALIVIAAAALTTALGAYGYTRLNNAGAALVIGSMLILSIPLRRLARRRDLRISDAGLGASAVGYGVVVGGTSGSGVILLSLLMAAGLEGAAVIAYTSAGFAWLRQHLTAERVLAYFASLNPSRVERSGHPADIFLLAGWARHRRRPAGLMAGHRIVTSLSAIRCAAGRRGRIFTKPKDSLIPFQCLL